MTPPPGIVVVDKPAGVTSHDVVGRCRRVFGTRVGGYGLDHARTLDELAEHPLLSYTLDEACLLAFPRRDITTEEADDASHGRPLPAARIDGVYAAADSDGRVIALLEDKGSRTKSIVVIRPATLAD